MLLDTLSSSLPLTTSELKGVKRGGSRKYVVRRKTKHTIHRFNSPSFSNPANLGDYVIS